MTSKSPTWRELMSGHQNFEMIVPSKPVRSFGAFYDSYESPTLSISSGPSGFTAEQQEQILQDGRHPGTVQRAQSAPVADERAAFEADTLELYPTATFNRFPNSENYNVNWVQEQWGGWQRRAKLAAPVAAPVVGQEPVLASYHSTAPHEDQGSLPTSQGEARQIAILGSTKGPFGSYTTPLFANVAQPVSKKLNSALAAEDLIEAAYWNFDARKKGYAQWKGIPQTERDAFKWEVRGLLNANVAQAGELSDEQIDEACSKISTYEYQDDIMGYDRAIARAILAAAKKGGA